MRENSTAALDFKDVTLDICGISEAQMLGGKTLDELSQATMENTQVRFSGSCKAIA